MSWLQWIRSLYTQCYYRQRRVQRKNVHVWCTIMFLWSTRAPNWSLTGAAPLSLNSSRNYVNIRYKTFDDIATTSSN